MENPFEIMNKRLDRVENLLENTCSNSQNNNTNTTYPEMLDP